MLSQGSPAWRESNPGKPSEKPRGGEVVTMLNLYPAGCPAPGLTGMATGASAFRQFGFRLPPSAKPSSKGEVEGQLRGDNWQILCLGAILAGLGEAGCPKMNN